MLKKIWLLVVIAFLVLMVVPLMAEPVSAATATYDFSSGAGTDKWAYEEDDGWSDIEENFGDHPTSPADGTLIEASSGDYTDISISNDDQWRTDQADWAHEWDEQLLKIEIDEDESIISQIEIEWEGHGSTGGSIYDAYMEIWDSDSSSWNRLHFWSSLTGETTCNEVISSDCDNYIDGSDYLYVLIMAEHSGGLGSTGVFTDYIEVTITYTPSNNAPSVSSVALWDTEASPSAATDMTPQVEYNVKVGVTDNDNLSDLSTVKATIFYDSDGSYSAGDVPSSGNTQTAAILTWTNGGGWSIDPSASTTWTIESGNCVAPTLTNTTGTFEFHFKPGKVATETSGSAKWHIYAKADDGTDTGDNHQDNRGMNWYGEISGITSSLDFGTVALGSAATISGTVSATYISNGAYDEQVKSGTWSGQTFGTTLDLHTSDTNPGTGQFSLKADDDATQVDSVQVLSASYVTIDDTGAQTGESGDTVSTNHCWLWLGSLGIPDEEYQGTIYFQIGDGA